jgi:hypothetical protein
VGVSGGGVCQARGLTRFVFRGVIFTISGKMGSEKNAKNSDKTRLKRNKLLKNAEKCDFDENGFNWLDQ